MAAAYVCACFVAVLVVDVASPEKIVEGWFPLAAFMVGALGLPGFAVLRIGLWYARNRTFFAFALAGALNASVALFLLDGAAVVHPVLNGAGLAAGGMYHVVIKAIGGQVAVRQGVAA